MCAPPSSEAPSNLSQQPDGIEVVHEDEDGWVSDQSSPEYAQGTMQPHAERRHVSGRSNRKRRTDDHRPSNHPHCHPRVSPPAQMDPSASIGLNTATASAPSLLSTSAAPEPPLPRTPSSLSDIVDDKPRGRAPPASASSIFVARRKQPRHMRIVSLRGSEASSREVSPVRSIRWADAGAGSTPTTARWPQSPSAQGSRAPSPSAQGSRVPSPSPADSAENETG